MMHPTLKRFKSKKNDVYAIKYKSKQLIIKIYKNKDTRVTEEKNLKILNKHGLKVPRVISAHKNILIEEYINGKTIGEIICTNTNWIEDLAKWLSKLHTIKYNEMSILKGDCNLRNFIYTKKGIYGIDFENTHYGNPIHDIGKICFFILDSTSTLTKEKKKETIKKFIQKYQKYSQQKINPKKLKKAMEKAKKEAQKRRKIQNH